MRLRLAAILLSCGTVGGLMSGVVGEVAQVHAEPVDCPPNCDRIPDSAWIPPAQIPLFERYRWPTLAGLAVPAIDPRFRFEDDCLTPPLPGDTRSYAVAARAVVFQPDGQWNLQVQVLHWRGDVARGGQDAVRVLRTAAATLRACQLTAPLTSPSITTDRRDRVAAVVSIGGERVLHQYLLAWPRSSTVVELAMWSTVPPSVPWPSVADGQIFDAMAAPLCTAYTGSCR